MPNIFDHLVDAVTGGSWGRAGEASKTALATQKQNQQYSAEEHDRLMSDYMDSIGAPVVQSGMVHRQVFTPPVNLGSYSNIPGVTSGGEVGPTSGYVVDKADPARTVTHVAADGQKVQWERPTVEQQQLRTAHMRLANLQNPQNKESTQIEDTREAAQAESKAQGTSLGTGRGQEQALEEAANGPQGVTIPDGSGVASGKRVALGQLPTVAAGSTSITELHDKLLADQKARLSQSLGSVTTPGAYKIVYGAASRNTPNWEELKANFDTPEEFDPIKSPMRARMVGMSPEQQQKTSLLLNTAPEEWDAKVDAAYPPTGPTAEQNKGARILVKGYLRRGEFDKADAMIKDGLDQQGKTSTAVATAKATAGTKIYVNSAEAANRMQATQNATGLGADDFARAGQEYGMTGIMPPLGRDSVTRGKIMKASNDWARDNGFSPKDIVTMHAAFKGDSKSLESMVKSRDQIAQFEQTATKNLDLFLNAASKIPDTGVPWLNKPLRELDQSIVGSTNMAAVNVARQVANNEIAKVTSGGALSSVLSDSARHEVEAYNPASATFKQTLAVAKILKADMANRKASLDAAVGEIKGRIGSGPNAPPAGASASSFKFLKQNANGHTIGSNGGPWVDVQTGQPVQ